MDEKRSRRRRGKLPRLRITSAMLLSNIAAPFSRPLSGADVHYLLPLLEVYVYY